jgi:hypothetical protein
MGLIRPGPPTTIISKLRKAYGVRTFVETGTFSGDTACWASQEFDQVITIECSGSLYQKAVQKYGGRANVQFLLGDSREKLIEIVPRLEAPSIFWLDAHWSGGETCGGADECPLIQEIHAINNSRHDHFLFIDDARMFESPPPRPHKMERWPSLDAVMKALDTEDHRYYVVVSEDVIIAVPQYAKQLVGSYCQEISTRGWEDHLRHQNDPALTGTQLISRGLKLLKQGFILSLRHLIYALGIRKSC